MKLLVVLVVGLLGCGSAPSRPNAAPAAPPAAPPQKASAAELDMLAKMDRFLASPLTSPDAASIKTFVIQSHDIHVVFDERVLPILQEDLDRRIVGRLTIGFLAGNASAQIRTGIRKNDPFAGVTGELTVYRAVKAASPFRSPGLDALLAIETKGELRAYLARPEPPPPPDESDTIAQLEHGAELAGAHRSTEALAVFEQIIATYQQRHAAERRRIYCASTKSETLAYLASAAGEKLEAIALSSTWADAWLGKSYVLTELNRREDARRALEQAIRLSPLHAQYLSERGYLAIQDKNWPLALELYTTAADNVALVEDPALQRSAHTRALRGQGYALLELGDLDASEARYKAALAIDPSDDKSKAELQFLWDLRAKKSSPR